MPWSEPYRLPIGRIGVAYFFVSAFVFFDSPQICG
jgi:hypothetical protein